MHLKINQNEVTRLVNAKKKKKKEKEMLKVPEIYFLDKKIKIKNNFNKSERNTE